MEKGKKLEFTIITGLSGAGKSEAIHYFEDEGYFCIDNLPPNLISDMSKLASLPGSKVNKIAVTCDVRGGEFFEELEGAINQLKEQNAPHKILFLEASEDRLINRFKETRRRHPLAQDGPIIEGIAREKELMEHFRGMADIIVDTTDFRASQLREKLQEIFTGTTGKPLVVTVISFGYKYGIPVDTDLMFDVRFLPNPHYIPELRPHSGESKPVRDFVLKRGETKEFVARLHEFLVFLLPHYIKEGKSHLAIAMGCTGGTHRSVALAVELAEFLKKQGYPTNIRHKDLGKEIT